MLPFSTLCTGVDLLAQNIERQRCHQVASEKATAIFSQAPANAGAGWALAECGV